MKFQSSAAPGRSIPATFARATRSSHAACSRSILSNQLALSTAVSDILAPSPWSSTSGRMETHEARPLPAECTAPEGHPSGAAHVYFDCLPFPAAYGLVAVVRPLR